MTLEQQIVKTAMDKMSSQGYFSICDFKKWCEILRVSLPSHELAKLSALHCIHFADMPADVLTYVQEQCVALFAATELKLLEVPPKILSLKVS